MPLTLKIRHCHYVSKNLLYPAAAFCGNVQNYSKTCSQQHNVRNKIKDQPQTNVAHPLSSAFAQNSNQVVPVFRRALEFADNTALKDNAGSYTYTNLILGAKQVANKIRTNLSKSNGSGQRVAFLCPNNANSVVALWAVWIAGHSAVPLNPDSPEVLLEHFCSDCDAKLLISTPEYAELMNKIAKKTNKNLLVLDANLQEEILNKVPQNPSELECGLSTDFYTKENALILYSFDSQQKPRGIVLSHRNLQTQINSQITTWKWTSNDTMLHVLPLSYFQGLINGALCPMYVGAQCTMLPKFDAAEIWSHLLAIKYNGNLDHKITVFMAEPRMYHKLLQEYEKLFAKNPKMIEYIKNVLKMRIRLMLNVSSPLSEILMRRWSDVTGHMLMDTYGKPETGTVMFSTKPYQVGESLMDGISVRVAKPHERHNILVEWSSGVKVPSVKKNNELNGELHIKGEQIFKGYINRNENTVECFTKDGWYITGDHVRYDADKKLFQLKDANVIRTGDQEVNAAEIEHQLLSYPDIVDCAVVGIPDTDLGQRVAAVLVGKNGTETVDAENVKIWAKDKLPQYAVPTELKVVECIPKNYDGNVNRQNLIESYFTAKNVQ